MFFGLTNAKANAKLQKAAATGDFADAIAAYRTLIKKTPSDYELFNNLGFAYLESGALGESVDAFQEAVRLFSCCVHYNNLGRALLKQKNYDAARAAFTKARELDATDPQPWYNLTVLLREQGQLEEARRELVEFLKSHPKHANGLNDLGCHHLDSGETADAIRCFTQVVDHNPEALPARLSLIRLLCDAKRFPDARPHLEALARYGLNVKVRAENDIVSIELNGSPFYPLPHRTSNNNDVGSAS